MSLYEITPDGFKCIPKSTFQEKQIKERDDLQKLLKNQISVISDDLLIISEEFSEWDESYRRVDLLALDKKANLVVIEIKRTNDGGHMELQAIRYAAMISTMTFSQVCDTFGRFLRANNKNDDPAQAILDFLEWSEPNEEVFGNDVRILLISADFSKEITTAVIWLNQRGLDIRCFRLLPHDFCGKTILDIQQIIPLPEAEAFQVKVKEKSQATRISQSLKVRWDLPKLLKTIEENTSALIANVSEDIYNWSAQTMNRIWWSNATKDGSFIPVLDTNNGDYIFFAVRSTGKIELYLGQLKNKPPFDNTELRVEFIQKLNKVGAKIPEEKTDGFPKFSIEELLDPPKLDEFKSVILWALAKANNNCQP